MQDYVKFFGMKLSDILYLPYSQAHSHFKQAAHSEWKGRTVHRIVGALEYIPLLNYLIVLVDLAVQRFFKSKPSEPRPSEPLRPHPSLQQFLQTHQIQLPKTPLLETVLDIEGCIGEWDESKPPSDIYWNSRIRVLGQQISKLDGKVDAEKLKPFKDSFRNNTAQVFKDFKTFLMGLKPVEEEKSQAFLSVLQGKFAPLSFAQAPSFDALMASMQFTDKVRLHGSEWSFAKLQEFGLSTFEDFKSIGFFDFENDYQTAVCFEIVTKDLSTAQKAYEQFLAGFTQKVSHWTFSGYASTSVRQFSSAQDIRRLAEDVRPLLLESYLKQANLNRFWSTFPPQSRSLAAYLIESDPKPSPFGLGFQIEVD